MVATAKSKCSFSSWYPLFSKDTFEATILPIPENVQKYLEHDAFILPKEATKKQSRAQSKELEWSDGSLTNADAADVSTKILSNYRKMLTVTNSFSRTQRISQLFQNSVQKY